jgi:hypothetical protein
MVPFPCYNVLNECFPHSVICGESSIPAPTKKTINGKIKGSNKPTPADAEDMLHFLHVPTSFAPLTGTLATK